MSRIVVMGSGETAPTMVSVHREVFAATPKGPAVLLDTPFAFQANRDELVARARLYFAQSVGREVEAVRWPPTQPGAPAEERAASRIDQATWAFAGPGSPTYALRHWRDTSVPSALAGVARRGGTLVLGSAAAVTLGTHAVPVYEIYKVGAEPEWADGLDLLGDLCGIAAAVVPHYDNREGGTHDTRFCYLGEQRLQVLESLLPAEVGILGVDEHTAVELDLSVAMVRVVGNGVLSVRRRGSTRTFAAGQQVSFADVSALLRGDEPVAPADVVTAQHRAGDRIRVDRPTSLREESERARAAFDAAASQRDADGCVAAVLALETGLASWGADTLQGGDVAEARRVLRSLVVRLGGLAEVGLQDPREAFGPYVGLLLELRAKARVAGDFAASDVVRERLATLGVQVRDSPTGSTWSLDGT